MKTIWKFDLVPIDGPQAVDMPAGAEIVHLHSPNQATIWMWALVDSGASSETRYFQVEGTGHDMSHHSDDGYVGTTTPYPLVWHVFEVAR